MTTAGNSLGRIQIRDLSIRLGQGSEAFEAVRDLSLEARPGEFVCLLGPSGCGKSTLLGALAGHLRPSAGSVRVDGRSVEGPSPQRGMVFQQHTLFPWRRVRDNVAFGLKMQGLARASATGAPWRCSDWWGWRTSPGAGPANCPGVCSSAWRSPGCWSTGRACC